MEESTSFIRDMKLDSILLNSSNVKTRSEKGKFSFLYNYKKINELCKLGGIIIGSRALKFYNIKNIPLISREVKDWDILISKNSFDKFCNNNLPKKVDMPIYKLGTIDWEKCKNVSNLTLSVGTLFKQNINIFISDKLPDYIECGNYKISSLESIMEHKINIIRDNIRYLKYNSKNEFRNKVEDHINDFIEVMYKMKADSDPLYAIKFILDVGIEFKIKALKDLLQISA